MCSSSTKIIFWRCLWLMIQYLLQRVGLLLYECVLLSRASYWKSQPRRFCEVCKCWTADNKAVWLCWVGFPKLEPVAHWRSMATAQWVWEDMAKCKKFKHVQCTLCTLSQLMIALIYNWNDFASFCHHQLKMLCHICHYLHILSSFKYDDNIQVQTYLGFWLLVCLYQK